MTTFLPLLCFLSILAVCSSFEGMCPRKDPPPGVLVVSPGSRLELACSGDVKVNGVRVPSSNKGRSQSDRNPTTQQPMRNRAFTTKGDQTSAVRERYHIHTTTAGGNRSRGHSDSELTASTQLVQPRPRSKTTTEGESDQEDKEIKLEAEYKDEEKDKGSRVRRGTETRPQWKWNRQLVQSDGSSLSLSSVRLTDAGKYTCHHRGEETLAVKVVVADPPETPSIFCYKKSPRSKIRCESKHQKPVIKQPECSLFLSKGDPSQEKFRQYQCSYSSRLSRCWCALEDDENERRIYHAVFLCVTNVFGNATSPLIHFTPLDILKPDPPLNVTAHPVEKLERMIKVTWNLPGSWCDPDDFYDLIYEIRYRPLTSSNEQVNVIKDRQYTITDALPGSEYLIHLRTKDEYDGEWSEWTSPVSARSWTAKEEEEEKESDLSTAMIGLPSIEDFGSGYPDSNYLDGTTNDICNNSQFSCGAQYHILWISALFAIMSVLLAVYIFRHKDRFMSKLHNLSASIHSVDFSPSPSIPSASEGEALVSGSGPQLYKQRPLSDTQVEEENEVEQAEMDQLQATNFNNKSYFFLQMEP